MTTQTQKKKTRKRKPVIPSAVVTAASGSHRTLRFRYCSAISIDAAATVFGKYTFSANSLYDPDVTGTGHQPLGYDQWSEFYNHYTVMSSKISVTFVCRETVSPSTLDDAVVGICLMDDNSIPFADVNTMREQGRARFKYMSSRLSVGPQTVTHTYDARRFHGVKDPEDNSALQGRMGNFGTGGPPGDQAMFILFVGPQDGATDANNYLCNVTIDYIARLKEPREFTQS